MKFPLLLAFIVLNTISGYTQSKVYFLPTLHGIHGVNKQYSFRNLREVIQQLNPSVIAVEIRPEDVDSDSAYIKQNYPAEMWIMRYWFPSAKIRGFDWLGQDIERKPIPANYWKEISPIKQWEKALENDSVYTKKLSTCDTFSNERMSLLKTLSLKELLQSKDEQLTNNFYACLREKLQNTPHQRVVDFYDERNSKILSNINRIISENKGKTIVILIGDDHYQVLRHAFVNDAVY
ncbi:MAG: DUF5694 domain-containing protein [Candidatus Dadabacteria bacterium]